MTASNDVPPDRPGGPTLPHSDSALGDDPARGERADRVRLADTSLPLYVLRKHATDYATLFSRARAEVGHGQCLCQS
ncbi:hypothetical protein ACWGJ2_40450, partial [Streptomyces sp. NPDC054796]